MWLAMNNMTDNSWGCMSQEYSLQATSHCELYGARHGERSRGIAPWDAVEALYMLPLGSQNPAPRLVNANPDL
jgi:hypothetical protein